MKSGYDQFFKNAKKVAAGQPVEPAMTATFTAKPKSSRLSSNEIADELRKRVKPQLKRKAKKPTPWKLITVSGMGLIVAALGMMNIESIEHVLKNVELSMIGQASAQAQAPANAPAKTAEAPKPAAKTEYTQEDINHFTKLNERKRQLDEREEELARMEAELQTQRQELEKKLSELQTTRREISSVLEEKVKTDETKVETLVQMYSNMKPAQAAKVFESMDEDLAIEILGRMKKKNAAEIMGFVKPEKVQVLTEKFAGYKN